MHIKTLFVQINACEIFLLPSIFTCDILSHSDEIRHRITTFFDASRDIFRHVAISFFDKVGDNFRHIERRFSTNVLSYIRHFSRRAKFSFQKCPSTLMRNIIGGCRQISAISCKCPRPTFFDIFRSQNAYNFL